MGFIKKNRKWITLGGLALAIIACFFPFAKVTAFGFSQSINFIDGGRDGIIVIIAAVVAGILVFLKKEKFSVIPTGIATLVVLYDIINIAKVSGQTSLANASVSIGAILILVGLIVAIVMPFILQDK